MHTHELIWFVIVCLPYNMHAKQGYKNKLWKKESESYSLNWERRKSFHDYISLCVPSKYNHILYQIHKIYTHVHKLVCCASREGEREREKGRKTSFTWVWIVFPIKSYFFPRKNFFLFKLLVKLCILKRECDGGAIKDVCVGIHYSWERERML